MLICPKCGNYNPDGVAGCLRCGTSFPRQVPTPAAAQPAARPGGVQPVARIPAPPAADEQPKAKAETPGWVTGGLLASIAVGLAGLVISGLFGIHAELYFMGAAIAGFLAFSVIYAVKRFRK